jgi:hypothetical protein
MDWTDILKPAIIHAATIFSGGTSTEANQAMEREMLELDNKFHTQERGE